MKRNNIVRFATLLILLGLFIFTGCPNAISPPSTSNAAGEDGSLLVSIANEGSGRTLLPNAPAFSGYELEFAGPAGATRPKMELTSAQAAEGVIIQDLDAGDWTISAKGLVTIGSENKVAAEGTGTKTITANAAHTLEIKITAKQSNGTGTFDFSGIGYGYDLGELDAAQIFYVLTDAGDVEIINLKEDGTSAELAAGYYMLDINLVKGTTAVRYYDVLHIYSNMTTKADWQFSEEDYIFVDFAGELKDEIESLTTEGTWEYFNDINSRIAKYLDPTADAVSITAFKDMVLAKIKADDINEWVEGNVLASYPQDFDAANNKTHLYYINSKLSGSNFPIAQDGWEFDTTAVDGSTVTEATISYAIGGDTDNKVSYGLWLVPSAQYNIVFAEGSAEAIAADGTITLTDIDNPLDIACDSGISSAIGRVGATTITVKTGEIKITLKDGDTEVDPASFTAASKIYTVEVASTLIPAKLVKFNAPDAVYDGGVVTGTGTLTGGEGWLLYPLKVNVKTDDITIEAMVKILNTGDNGIGFISVDGSGRKGYMINTSGGVKNAGTTNGGGGQGFTSSNGGVSSTVGVTQLYRTEIKGGKIAHSIFKGDGTTLLGYKDSSFSSSYGHAETDVVYAAVGGKIMDRLEWSNIKITVNGTQKYGINGLNPQSVLPSLSVSDTTVRIALNAQSQVTYTATGGESAAEVDVLSSNSSIVRIDSTANGTITFTGVGLGDATITVTNQFDTSLTAKIAVTVTDFATSDPYDLSGKVYPAAAATGAYTDGELMITFDEPPALSPSGSVSIFNRTSGEMVDLILFANEKQATLNGTKNVGSQLARVEGNSVYITPHYGKLADNTTYYVGIPRGAITGKLGGQVFDGLSDSKEVASWSFTTRTAPALSATVTVDGSQNSTANYRTVYGALSAIAAKTGEWTINVAPGTYNELVQYVTSAADQTVTINGTGSENYGDDVVIQYMNSNDMNSGDDNRPSFFFSGANLVIKNVKFENTSSRKIKDPGQTEAFSFKNGAKTLIAYNCSFINHQDTIKTFGKNWFYKCYIEGDVDFMWGYADVCLFEECKVVSVNDPFKTSSKAAILIAARVGNTSAATVGKGYVLFKSTVTTQDGMTTYLGRNPGAGTYYDQLAIVNTKFINEGSGTVHSELWSGSTYVALTGKDEHIGFKFYGNTVNDTAMDVSSAAKGKAIPADVYNLEYNGRDAILNRIYNKNDSKYEWVSSKWDISAFETEFGATADESADNEYPAGEPEPTEPEIGKTYTYNFRDGSVFPASTISSAQANGFISIDPNGTDITYNGSQHGYVMKAGNKIKLKVAAGNAIVSIVSCQYTNAESLVQLTSSTGTIAPAEAVTTQVTTDGDLVSFTYTGTDTAGEVVITLSGSGQSYFHGIVVDSVPVAGETITYNFLNGSVFPASTISSATTNKFITIDPNGTDITYNGSQHGYVMQAGNKITLKVAGNVTISILSCQYTNAESLVQLTSSTGTIAPAEAVTTKVATDGDLVSFTYTGTAGEVVMTLSGSGRSYFHGIKVE